MTQALATVEHEHFMPALPQDEILQRHHALAQFRTSVLREGTDYGVVPGTGNKPTLLKPGAEKLCTFFGLTPRFEQVRFIEDWTGAGHGGEPLFYYLYKCSLFRGTTLIAEGEGSCSSWEKKYRYRNAERLCPHCGAPAIIKGKSEYGGGFICFNRRGGCGAKFADNDPAITAQVGGKSANPDVADVVNTVQKMGQKRALVAATLIAANASEYFTQDVEDFAQAEAYAPEPPVRYEPEPLPEPPPLDFATMPRAELDAWIRANKGTNHPSMETARRVWQERKAAAQARAAAQVQGPGTIPAHPTPTVGRLQALMTNLGEDPAFANFVGAAAAAGLPFETDANLVAFETAATPQAEGPVVAETLDPTDWDGWAHYIKGGKLTW